MFKLSLSKSINMGLYVKHIEELSAGSYQPILMSAETRNSEFAAVSFRIKKEKARAKMLA